VLIGYADFDRPITFEEGRIFYPFGAGAFQLEPYQCAVLDSSAGPVAFQLDLIRAFSDRDSQAILSCTIGADYASDAALAHVRELHPAAALSSCVLTEWSFRLLSSPALRVPDDLAQPVLLASNGLGTARLIAPISIESGLLLEAMLRERVLLTAVAEAQLVGVSPRVPVVVRFESSELLGELLQRADATGTLTRQAICDYFGREDATLPLAMSGTIDVTSLPRFADTMADRVITRFGRYVPARADMVGPLVQLDLLQANTSTIWSLSQPVLAARRIALPVDLLSAAQAQVMRLGIDSVVQRRTLTSLPGLGQSRVTVFCNLPTQRLGVDALGVGLLFPPHPPERAHPKQVTTLFESTDDIATVDVTLSPGEPLLYRYSPFVVVSDDLGTRQINAPEAEYVGSPLRLSPEHFPVEFALIEMTPALGQLAAISGICTYDLDGRTHEKSFTLDSGQLSIGIAVPRERTQISIECLAIAREGAGQIRLGPFESPQVRLDVTSFEQYGAHQVAVQCVFDDDTTIQAVSFVPMGSEESAGDITTIAFTPAEPARIFRWFARSPFASGFRYRAFDEQNGAWTEVRSGEPLMLYSSKLRKSEPAREVAARSGRALREVVPLRPGRRLEAGLVSAEAAPTEAAVLPLATSPEPEPTDELLYTRIDDATHKLFLPRYTLDIQVVSGQPRYRISMSQRLDSSTLEVNLVAAPAPSLAEAARSAEEYPHSVTLQLEFLVTASSGAKKTLEFKEVTRNGSLITAVLTFATLQERDDTYRALTETERHARLVVRRFFDVSLPQRPAPTTKPGDGKVLQLSLPPRPIFTLQKVAVIPRIVAHESSLVLANKLVAMGPLIATTNVVAASQVVGTSQSFAATNVVPANKLIAADRLNRSDVLVKSDVLVRPDRFVETLPTPSLTFAGRQDEGAFTRCRLSVANWADFSNDFFAASSDLPPCGLNKAASRTWVDIYDADSGARLYGFCALSDARQLQDLWFAVSAGNPVPARVGVRLTDRRANVVRNSNAVATSVTQPDVPPYRAVRQELAQTIDPDPFVFSPALHAYVFQGLTPASGNNQLIRYRLQWKGRFHTYLQDASRPSLVYSFADQFKIARRRDAPFTPFITVRVVSRSDASDTDVVFDYVVAPYTDAKRLENAAAQLAADPRFGATQVDFQPFLTSDVRYFIDRPSSSGAVREQRADAPIVLQGALKDTLNMSLTDFRLLFDAMHRRTASLFVGRVEVDVPNADTEIIPFEARMDDLEGELFSYEASAVSDGTIKVTVRNEIESPLSIQTLDTSITRGGQRVRGFINSSSLPRDRLLPGDTLELTVTPETPLDGTAPPEVTFDLSGVSVIPDPEAVLDSILDRSVLEFFRIVKPRAIGTLFAPIAGREDENILNILIDFEGGGTADLSATALEASVRIDYSIDDVVLGRSVSSIYRYTVTVVRANNRQDRDPQPREQSADLFFVSVVR
jgi:hypothetical protein